MSKVVTLSEKIDLTETDAWNQMPTTEPNTHQDGSEVQFTIANETDASICFANFWPAWQTEPLVEPLGGDEILPGESRTFDLPTGKYTLLIRNCAQTMVLYRSYLDVSITLEIHVTERDVQIAACQGRSYIGALNFNAGRYSKALEDFYAALDCYRAVPYLAGEGEAQNNIGLVRMRRGRYAEAKNLFYQALDKAKEVGDRDGESKALNSLASLDMDLGHLEEALAAFQKALEIRRALSDPIGEATILNNMAILYGELGREDKALDHYEQVLDIYQQTSDRLHEANTLNNMAQSFVRLGDYDRALETFEEALAIMREPGVDNPFIEGRILNGIGLAHAHEERFADALEAFEGALAINRAQEDQAGESRHLYLVARILDDLGRQEDALSTYGEAMDVLESVREFAGSDDDRAGFINQFAHLYEHALDLNYRQGLHEEAFYVAERGRARAFLDLIGNQPIISQEDSTAGFSDQQLMLRNRMNEIEAEIEHEQAKPFSEQNRDVLDGLKAELEDVRSEYERIFKRLRSLNTDYISLVSVKPMTITDLQNQVLDEHTTLIEYFVLEEYTLAWVVDQEDFSLIRLDISRDDLRNKVKLLLTLMGPQEFDEQTAESLYDVLFAPLKPHIRHSNLVIAPHKVLHYLPFASLLNAESERFLVEDYAITYAPSASALNFILEKRNDDENRLLAMGNPDGSLPFAEEEAKIIAGLYDTTPLLAKEASESQLYDQVNQLDVLHLAAHGTYDANHPLFTRVELAPDASQDGYLEVHEVYDMDLTEMNMVVLSACNTALGQRSEGDELIGLTRAFLYAGTPAIVTTLWTIDDAASGSLMESFYSHLRNGLTNAEALRNAQLDVLAQDQWRQPYYWAAFNLTGDYRGHGDPNLVTNTKGDNGFGLCFGTALILGAVVILRVSRPHFGRKRRVLRRDVDGD